MQKNAETTWEKHMRTTAQPVAWCEEDIVLNFEHKTLTAWSKNLMNTHMLGQWFNDHKWSNFLKFHKFLLTKITYQIFETVCPEISDANSITFLQNSISLITFSWSSVEPVRKTLVEYSIIQSTVIIMNSRSSLSQQEKDKSFIFINKSIYSPGKKKKNITIRFWQHFW